MLTIFPVNDSPLDDDYGPRFPRSAGGGMIAQLREAGMRFLKPKKAAKKINKEAMGTQTPRGFRKPSVKKGKKPENLRASAGKKKHGVFGETYTPVKAPNKGVRVAESDRRFAEALTRFHREAMLEKAPPGWEGTVKAMKKHSDIDNPFALAWSMKNKGDQPHH